MFQRNHNNNMELQQWKFHSIQLNQNILDDRIKSICNLVLLIFDKFEMMLHKSFEIFHCFYL